MKVYCAEWRKYSEVYYAEADSMDSLQVKVFGRGNAPHFRDVYYWVKEIKE